MRKSPEREHNEITRKMDCIPVTARQNKRPVDVGAFAKSSLQTQMSPIIV